LGTLFQLSITIGILIAYVVGYFLVNTNDRVSWRLMFAAGILPSFNLIFLTFAFMPESERWLKRAQKEMLEGVKEEEYPPLMGEDKRSSGSGWGLLFSRGKFRSLALGVILALSLQLTGINAVMYYAPDILEGAGFHTDKYLLTIFVGAWNMLTTVVAVFLSDRVNRRFLMIIGLAIMTTGDLILGFCYQFSTQMGNKTQGIVSIVALALFIGGFEIGPGALFWVFLSEIYSSYVKDQANGFINLLQWGFNLGLSILFPVVLHQLPTAAPIFFFFTGVGIFAVIYVAFQLPRGKENLADNSVN